MLLFGGGLALALVCAGAALTRRVSQHRRLPAAKRKYKFALLQAFSESQPDADTVKQILECREGHPDLLATNGYGQSCLMVWAQLYSTNYYWSDHGDDHKGLAVLQLLLDTAEQRGELRELLEITDGNGANILHWQHSLTPARLRIILEAVAKISSLPTKSFPSDICELIRSFLARPLLDQRAFYERTPLVHLVHYTRGYSFPPPDALYKARMLVQAGADPNLITSDRQTALDVAKGRFQREDRMHRYEMSQTVFPNRAHRRRSAEEWMTGGGRARALEFVSYLESITGETQAAQ